MFYKFILFCSFIYSSFVEGSSNFTSNTTHHLFPNTEILKPKYFLHSNHVIAPNYNLTSCYIGKSLSSMTLGLFCYLYDEKTFLTNYKTALNGGANRRLCRERNSYSSISKIAEKYTNGSQKEILQYWTNIMIVREPISRFISGFVQLCVLNIGLTHNHSYCFNCKKNIKCFLKKLYNHILNLKDKPTNVDKFIMYHFYPQSWQCEYLLYKDNYTIILYKSNVKSFYNQYLSKLRDSSVPLKKIEFIKRLLFNSKLTHSTSNIKATKLYMKKLLKNSYLMDLVKKIYNDDYLEFKFKAN